MLGAPLRLLRVVSQRPDLWTSFLSLASAVPVYWLTPLSASSVDYVIFDRLAHSFAAATFIWALFVFVRLLLRRARPEAARALRLGWLGLMPPTALGLLFAYPPPSSLSTSWVLQAILLASLAWGLLLAALLPALGLLRWNDLGGAARDILRDWSGVLLYLFVGGYLLGIVRVYSPQVYDPLLFKMDASLGWRGVEAIAAWNLEHPLARLVTRYSRSGLNDYFYTTR